jgi:type VI secretion system Hcp family effector
MRRGQVWLAAAAAVMLAIAAPATAFAAWYAKFDGVDGSSQAADHTAWIDLISVSVPLSPQSLPRGPGKITVTKRPDKATPKLMEAAVKGKVFSTVTLDASTTSGGRTAYMRYRLTDVMISHVQPGSTTETLVISFSRIVLAP